MPPFKSQAQRDKWVQLRAEGRVSQEAFDAREAESKGANLPVRATPRRRTVGPSRGAEAAKVNDRRY